jgi:uncharacterized peroxidase-related enzyme
VVHHGEALRRLTGRELVEQIVEDYTQADLDPADRAMLDYAARLTRTPQEVGVEDVERLREVGFDDRAILDVVQVTAYFAFVNRLASGLGVSLEVQEEEA